MGKGGSFSTSATSLPMQCSVLILAKVTVTSKACVPDFDLQQSQTATNCCVADLSNKLCTKQQSPGPDRKYQGGVVKFLLF